MTKLVILPANDRTKFDEPPKFNDNDRTVYLSLKDDDLRLYFGNTCIYAGFRMYVFRVFVIFFLKKMYFFSESNTFQTEIVNNYKRCFLENVCISQFSHV